MPAHDPKQPQDLIAHGLSSIIRRARSRHLDEVEGDQPRVPPLTTTPIVEEKLPDELAGYPVIELIARGGVGLVYRCFDDEIGRELAIKILSNELVDDLEIAERFHNEAQVCGQLQHPGVVPVYQMGTLADGREYFTMRLVEGETMSSLLHARKSMTQGRGRFLDIFLRVCQTMSFAHSRGVVHGDIKPGNVMVGSFGEVQVMDWGFAKLLDVEPIEIDGEDAAHQVATDPPDPERSSDSLHILGTPAYMSPEQARGDDDHITQRTDVFGLGAILCEILTGKPPYIGSSKHETYALATRAWLDDAERRLRDCEVESDLFELTLACLRPDPADRPADAGEVEREIAGFLDHSEQRAREADLKAARAEARAAHERRARRMTMAFGGTLLASVIVGAVALMWWRSDQAAQRQEINTAVARATERAEGLRQQALAEPAGDPHHWDEALAAAQQAEDFAISRHADPAVLAQAQASVATIGTERAAAIRTRDLLEWLDEHRPMFPDDRGNTDIDRDYVEGLTRFGFDLDTDAAGLAAQISNTAIPDRIAIALDEWALLRALDPRAEAHQWDWVIDAAMEVDADPFRNQLREAVQTKDRERLRAMLEAPDLEQAPKASAALLAKALSAFGDRDDEVSATLLMKQLAELHPDDYWLQHDLSVLARWFDTSIRDGKTIARQAAHAAHALRPDSSHMCADLAAHLTDTMRLAEAERLMRRSLRRDPSYARSWLILTEVLLAAGRHEEAWRTANQAVEALPDSSAAHFCLANAAYHTWRLEVAVREYRVAVELNPDLARGWQRLAEILRDLDRDEEAVEALVKSAEAVERGPSPERARWYRRRAENDAYLLDPTKSSDLQAMLAPQTLRGIRRLAVAEAAYRRGELIFAAENYEAYYADPKARMSRAHYLQRPISCALQLGFGEAGAELSPEQRRHWRAQALDLLDSWIEHLVMHIPVSALSEIRRLQISPWMKLAREREGLQADEEQLWSEFWQELEDRAERVIR